MKSIIRILHPSLHFLPDMDWNSKRLTRMFVPRRFSAGRNAMKKLFMILSLLSPCLWAQESDLSLINNATLHILVNDVTIANDQLNSLVRSYGLKIGKTDINNTERNCEYLLYSRHSVLIEVLGKMEKLGAIDLEKMESSNHAASLKANSFDLEYLMEQKTIYRNELAALDKGNDSYEELFNKERELDRQIYDKNKERMQLEGQIEYSEISLRFFEKTVQDLDSRDDFMDFINMPGVETKFFSPENPEDSAIGDRYLGGSLRYMFTKGRSYFLIGIMKPLTAVHGDTAIINDIVTYGIGKDFYPRYFGQGRNTFFNPYSGFEFGGMVLTSESAIDHLFTVEPHIGVEIFKNKYVIMDARVGYLFPMDEDRIKTHRGLTQNLSVNIVF